MNVHMSLLLIFISGIFSSTFFLSKKLSYISPPVVMGFVWAGVALVGFVVQSQYFPIAASALISWALWFLGANLVFWLFLLMNGGDRNVQLERRDIVLPYEIFVFAVIIYEVYLIFSSGFDGSDEFFRNLRINYVYGQPDIFLTRIYPLLLSLFIFECIYSDKLFNRRVLFVSVSVALYAIYTMGRLEFLSFFIIFAASYYIRTRKLKILIISSALFLVLFVVMQIARNPQAGLSEAISSIGLYIYSPLVALGTVSTAEGDPFGQNVFRFAYAILGRLGVGSDPIDTVLPFVNVPLSTNVYTAIYPFYRDFGYPGVIVGAIATAAFLSTVYYCMRRFSAFLPIYIALLPAFFMQFFHEGFLTLASYNIQVVLYLFLLTFFSRSRKESGFEKTTNT